MGDVAKERNLKDVVIYTDGAAIPNPGAGGYGVVLRCGQHQKELSGGYRVTTNNRMELMAVIVGLEALKVPCKVTLYSDSQYIVNAITSGSAFRWRDNGWGMNQSGTKKAKNCDLWARLLTAYEQHAVDIVWVKGHAGIADNERCDLLAMEACKRPSLPPDLGYTEEPRTDGGAGTAESKTNQKHSYKMTFDGQLCRNCGTPVFKKAPKKKTIKEGQTHYYSWYLFCPGCKNIYMVEEAKVKVGDDRHRRSDRES